jgi:DNA-binding response OmpR family regulator
MTGHGFRVIAAKAEEGALTEASAQRPDAIIVDLATLAGEGMEVVRAFRSNEATMHVPMLAITDGDLDDRDRQVLAGAFIPTVSSAWKDGDLVDQLEEAIIGREVLQHARLS